MGVGAAVASIGVSIVGDMIQSSAASDATDAKIAALETRKKQEEVAEKSRSIQRADNLQTVVTGNLALAGARGISPVSGSFKAIQNKDFEKFNEDENMDELNTLYKEQSLDAEERGVSAEGEAKEIAPFLKTGADIFKSL